ncbi:MAG: class I SAM-dependent methyltransferase [Candidatus Dojkabacteria bacterium]|jgi:ubiquinone/menaquinone biosynthesis C-methylase UbiE
MKNEVTDYDLFGYDYSSYWKNRGYENLAEKNVLNKIFREETGIWFLDIGGSYGRLTSTYYPSYSNPIICDFSMKTLQKNRDSILSRYPNAILLAGNAYKLPFKNNTFDGALMVRVLHHIEDVPTYFKEIARVMANNSTYVQEIPNKVHLKASIKALLQLNFKFFDKTPYEHPLSNGEGTREGLKGIFFNYHPKDIKEKLEEVGFTIKRKYGCSYLRIPFLKKIFNEDIMMFFERIFQNTLSWTNISPSIIFVSKVKKGKKRNITGDLNQILLCPKCKSDLLFKSSTEAQCKKCKTKYKKENDIWDFRVI